MGNVINLPEKPVMEWMVIEKKIRLSMAVAGLDQATMDHVCTVMRPVWLSTVRVDVKFERSDDPEKTMDQINQWFTDFSLGMFNELIVREVELYKLRGKK